VSLTEDLRRLQEASRVRLAAVATMREQQQLIARQSRRRLDDSRRLLDRDATDRRVPGRDGCD
jgi:hypothetical protein